MQNEKFNDRHADEREAQWKEKQLTHPNIVLRETVIHSQIHNPRGKALIQPKVGPPLHGNQVAEPHVRDFVGNSQRHIALVYQWRLRLVHQQPRLSVHGKN